MPPPTGRSIIRPALLWILAAILLLFQVGQLPLIDTDEARFAETSVEMLSRGDFVLPWFENHPRLQKPPLIHWAQILSFKIFGVNEFSSRLPSIFSGLGLLGFVLLLGRDLFDRKVALRAGFILATTPLFFLLGRIGTIDMTLGFLILSSIHFGLRALRPGLSGGRNVLLCGLSLGLCLLAKGPVGVIVFLLVISGYLIVSRDFRAEQLRKVLQAIGIAVAVFLPWFLLLASRVEEATIWATLRREVLHRFWQGSSHQEPFPYYLLAVIPAAFPWSCFLPGILLRFWRERKSDVNRSRLFLLAWFFLVLLFFSLCRDKLVSYVFPLFPALALLIANAWKESSRALISVGLAIFFFSVLSIVFLATILPLPIGVDFRPFLVALFLSLPAVAGILFLLPRAHAREGTFAVLAGWSVLFLLSTFTFLVPGIATSRSFRGTVERMAAGLDSNGNFIMYRDDSPSLFYYSGGKLTHINTEPVLRDAITACPDCAIVIRERYFFELSAATRSLLHEIDRAGKYLVFLPAREVPAGQAGFDPRNHP